MAIKVAGTTVIDDSRTLVNILGIKTVNGGSLLGSGDLVVLGGMSYSKKTANYAPIKSEYIYADTTAGGFTVTLPASPATGDTVVIADAVSSFASNNLVVGRNGSTIEGTAANATLTFPGLEYTFTYITNTWKVYTKNMLNGVIGNTYLKGPTVANEGTDAWLSIVNWVSTSTYTISVTAGSYQRISDAIIWTLPSVSSDANHTLTLTVNGTLGYTHTINVLNIASTTDTSISITDFSIKDSSTGWTTA